MSEERFERNEARMDKIEARQDRIEEQQRQQQIEFAETKVYVKETYKKLEDIQISIESLRNSTFERVDQQQKFFREEMKSLQDKPDNGDKKAILEFAKWTIGGILALATAALAIVQIYAKFGGGTP